MITAAEGGALHRRRLVTHYDYYEPYSRDRLVAGSLVPAAWVQQAQRVRHRVYRDALALFARYDVLIAPATPVPATPIGAQDLMLAGQCLPARASMGLLTQPISCLGLPVCAAPVWPGIGADAHLPLGVQLIAAPWRESDCLLAARRLERAGVATVRQVMPTPFLRPRRLQIQPRHQQKATREPQMLEEGIGGHEAFLPDRQLPETQRHAGRRQREEGQRRRAEPAQPARQDHGGRDQLQRDHQHGVHRRRRQAEMRHLAQGAGKIRQLHQAALQIGGAQPR